MQNMNKKGLAQVVTVMSLILLTTVATIIIATQVTNLLNRSGVQLSADINCLDYQSSLVVQIRKACYNIEDSYIELSLERKISSLDIPKIDFAIEVDGERERYTTQNCLNCNVLNVGATKTYYIPWEDFEEGKAIVHIDSCRLDEMEIKESC